MPERCPLHRGRERVRHLLEVVVAALVLAGCVHTEPFTDAQGAPIPGSVATMETVAINGVPQRLWFRGVDTSAPALILLHGGPGASESALFRHYNAALEQHFLVVYWDQRGAGRSYSADIPPSSMTIDQFQRDLDRVVDLVRQRFHKDQVVVLAHSWGAVLGTRYACEHPDKVAAYVAVAPLVDKRAQDALSWRYVDTRARARGDEQALAQLRAMGPVLRSPDDELALGAMVERYGGTFHNGLSTGKLIWEALSTDETNLLDLVKFGQGNRFSLHALWQEYSMADVTSCRAFAIPVFFLLGRHDWHVPSVVSAHYFDTIRSPYKRLVWFEHSAHNPPFEEPEKFDRVLIDQVLPRLAADSDRLGGRSSCMPMAGEVKPQPVRLRFAL